MDPRIKAAQVDVDHRRATERRRAARPRQTFVPEFGLGERLRRSREACGYTQQEMAYYVGISQRSVSNYERGVTPPNFSTLVRWHQETQVNLAWLATGNPKNPDPDRDAWNAMVANSVTPWSPGIAWTAADNNCVVSMVSAA